MYLLAPFPVAVWLAFEPLPLTPDPKSVAGREWVSCLRPLMAGSAVNVLVRPERINQGQISSCKRLVGIFSLNPNTVSIYLRIGLFLKMVFCLSNKEASIIQNSYIYHTSHVTSLATKTKLNSLNACKMTTDCQWSLQTYACTYVHAYMCIRRSTDTHTHTHIHIYT